MADLKRYHESVVQSLKTAVIVTDRELNITSTNRAVETHLGRVRDKLGVRTRAEIAAWMARRTDIG